MVGTALSRKVLEEKIRCARLVREWKRRSLQNRCSVAKLASELGLTRSKTVTFINMRPKKLALTREKIRVIREAARSSVGGKKQLINAAKLAQKCHIKRLSPRSLRRLTQVYRSRRSGAKGSQKWPKPHSGAHVCGVQDHS
jgi:hypothetical protein